MPPLSSAVAVQAGKTTLVIKRLTGNFSGEGYQARALRGSMMTMVNFGGHNALRLGSNLILTRILFPEAFGLMALVQVVLAATAMFSDFGITGSIVQHRRGEDPAFLNTAWTVQIGRGLALGLAVMLFAQPLADFYDEPQLGQLLLVAGIVPAIQGFNSTRMATMNRKIMLGRMTMLGLSTQAFGIVVMVVLAWITGSVWSLIVGTAAGAFALMLLSHVALPGTIRNRLHFEREAARDLFGYGKYVFLATLAGFFVQHGDRAVLGKYITLEELAIYNIGFFMATIPIKFARGLNASVIFPLYARRPPSESEENRRRINRARFLLTSVLVAGTALLGLIGNAMIVFLYDPRYEGGGPILVLIAISLLPQLVTPSYERLPLSVGRSGLYAFFVVTRSVILLALTLLGVIHFGLAGVVFAPLVTWALVYPILIWTIRRFDGWDPVHDAIYAFFTFALSGALLVYHWETVRPLLTPLLD